MNTTLQKPPIDPAELPPQEETEAQNELTDTNLNPEIKDEADKVDKNEERSSGRLEQSFLNFQAWRREMLANPAAAAENFSGAETAFMQECKKFYPNEVIAVEQAGAEVLKSRTRLEGLNEMPNLAEELAKTARNINPEMEANPVEMIREINKVLEPASRSVQQLLLEYPGEEFDKGSQLDECFREMFRLQILKKEIEATLTEEQKAALVSGAEIKAEPKGGKEPAPGESYEQFRARIENELNNHWQKFLEGQFKMSVNEWMDQNMPGDPDWRTFGSDTEKWQRLEAGLKEIKRKYQADERLKQVKDFDYKIALNELLTTL